MKMLELLADESRWHSGAFAIDADGKYVPSNDPSAQKFDLLSAIERCYGHATRARFMVQTMMQAYIRDYLGKDYASILYFNQSQPHEIIIKMLEDLQV